MFEGDYQNVLTIQVMHLGKYYNILPKQSEIIRKFTTDAWTMYFDIN